jgi:hypothetical protein
MFLSVRNLACLWSLHHTHSHSSASSSEESRTSKWVPCIGIPVIRGFLISAHRPGRLSRPICGPFSLEESPNETPTSLLFSSRFGPAYSLRLWTAASATTLVGTVTDSSGAAIPNASVVAVQNATKVSYKGQTTATGDYSLPYVDVGTYDLHHNFCACEPLKAG